MLDLKKSSILSFTMTIESIFIQLAAHMKTGIEMHHKMMEAYNFISLKGYKKCQEYHYLSELKEYLNLCQYYLEHYYKLLNVPPAAETNVFSSSWYKYTQQEVDTNTKRTAVRDIMKKWIDWETETKTLYQNMYKELIALNEVAAASFLKNYINDVLEELQQAQQKQIELETINYDAVEIIKEQQHYEKKYKKKLKGE